VKTEGTAFFVCYYKYRKMNYKGKKCLENGEERGEA
jgi:hypothetical protein